MGAESASQFEAGFQDALSAWTAVGKACPTLRCCGVFLTPAPCIEFDSPRYLYVIKKQVETLLYLLVTIGGASENLCEPYDSRERARNQSLH